MYRNARNEYRAGTGGKKSHRRSWIALGLLGVIAGCTNQQVDQALTGGGTKQVTTMYPLDGFLPKPQLLYPGAAGQPGLVYFAPGTSLSNYNAILIDPVTIVTGSSSALASASRKQRETLANLYYSELYQALSPICRVVRHTGPNTLRISVALSDAQTSNGAVKTVATYVPYINVAYKVGSVVFNDGAGFFSGSATSEAYATDSTTGALIWQGADTRTGSVALVQNTTNSWNDVDNAMKAWAQTAATRLKALGVCGS